jgi:hypothetical protein
MRRVDKHLTIVLLLLTGFLCGEGYADPSSPNWNLLVEGKSTVLKSDIARARETAVKNAQEKAILQAAEKLLLEKYADEKFQAVKSVLIGKTDRYVKNYRIAVEHHFRDEYTVSVDVVLSRTALRDDLVQMGLLENDDQQKGRALTVTLQGIRGYSDFVRWRSFFQSRTKMVKSFYPCDIEFRKATCHLTMIGDAEDLIAELKHEGLYEVEANVKNPDGIVIRLDIREEKK